MQETEPQMYLDGKLALAPAGKRVVEIIDILTWIQAFTIYASIFFRTHLTCWRDLTQYKLCILHTAPHFPRPAWLDYNVAFRKDAAASGLADWSNINLDLHNFHTGSLIASQHSPFLTSPSCLSSQSVSPISKRSLECIPHCHSWNQGTCRWPFGGCRYCHACKHCDGDQPSHQLSLSSQ